MSNREHGGQKMFQSWMDSDDLNALDQALEKLRFKNRAEWLRQVMRETIEKAKSL